MQSNDKSTKEHGKKILSSLFKSTLQLAFNKERNTSYKENRLPEYTEIIKSANELMRAGMYAYTDLYRNQKSTAMFEPTAFGGMSAKEMAELTVGDSIWKMDHKSEEAWKIQSKEARDIAEQWLLEEHPYEKMIQEMNDLATAGEKHNPAERKNMLLKLAAAEWLLMNNSQMMVEDPNDPLNPIPNWGNRYWKTLSETRETLHINKHTPIRNLIQNEYTTISRAVNSSYYNETQIKDHVTSSYARHTWDSMDKQREQFATLGASLDLAENAKDKSKEIQMNSIRVKFSVDSENEIEKMKNEDKVFNFIINDQIKVSIEANRGVKS